MEAPEIDPLDFFTVDQIKEAFQDALKTLKVQIEDNQKQALKIALVDGLQKENEDLKAKNQSLETLTAKLGDEIRSLKHSIAIMKGQRKK
jgi:cell division protein FtsB